MKYRMMLHRQAIKDLEKLKRVDLGEKAKQILIAMEVNPFVVPPPYEKLTGDLARAYFRRINIQHRLDYSIDEEMKEIRVARMWTHYE